ncbi:MAG: hypothetical protein Q7V19_13395, partial [Bacteroidales bacterium]|nr:hypothetical protein [Bacteroidales bacterium]
LLNVLIGLLLFLAGLIVFFLNLSSKDNELNDHLGANLKVYTGSILLVIGGIIMIIKELLK